MLTRRRLLQTTLLLPGLLGMLLQAAHAQETQEGRSSQSGDSKVAEGASEPFIRNEFGDEYFISSAEERRIVRSYAAISLTHNPEKSGRPVKTGSSRLRRIESRIGTRMIQPDFDHRPGVSIAVLAARIKKVVLEILAEERIDPASIVGQRLLAQGVCDWVRTHIVYNQALTPDPSTGQYDYPHETLKRFWTTELLLKEQTLFAVCAGLSRTTLDLSLSVGLKCEMVNGFTRGWNNTTSSKRDHAWVVYTFDDQNGKKEICPADVTKALVLLSRARQFNHVPQSPFCLPDNDSELGVFLWKEQASVMEWDRPLKDGFGLSRLSIEEWKRIPRDQALEKITNITNTECQKAVVRIPIR